MTRLALPVLDMGSDFRHMARARRDAGIVQRRALLDALRRAGGEMGTADLAAGLGICVNTLRISHLPRLVAAGVVAWDRRGGVVRLVRDVHDAGAPA